MKVIDLGKNSQGNKIIKIHLGYEEVDLLFGLVDKAIRYLPTTLDPRLAHRLSQMRRVLAEYTGRAKPVEERSGLSCTPCPKCERKLRGEEALKMHLLKVHSNESN